MVGESMTPVLEVSKLFAKSVKHSGENWLISVTFNPLAKINESVGFSRFSCDHLMELIFWRFFSVLNELDGLCRCSRLAAEARSAVNFLREKNAHVRYVTSKGAPLPNLTFTMEEADGDSAQVCTFLRPRILFIFSRFLPQLLYLHGVCFLFLCISRWWPTTTESFSAASVWRKTRWPMMIINQVRSIS